MAWNSSRTRAAGRRWGLLGEQGVDVGQDRLRVPGGEAGVEAEPRVAVGIESDDGMDPDPAQELGHGLAGPLPPGPREVKGAGSQQTDHAGQAGRPQHVDVDHGRRRSTPGQAGFGGPQQ